MLNIIRDKVNNVIVGFLHEDYNELSSCNQSIYKVAIKYDLRNISLFDLELFSNELYENGFISFIEYAILNFQFTHNSSNDYIINRIINDNLDRDFNINIIKVWEEYLDLCHKDQDNIPFINIIKALLKKLEYLEEIKSKYHKTKRAYEA